MLWLHENTADPGLSRLRCSTMAEFFALTARDDEDGDESERERISGLPPGGTEALAQQTDGEHTQHITALTTNNMIYWPMSIPGLYLSDIAEIRCGLASYDFCLCQAAAARLCQPDASGRGDWTYIFKLSNTCRMWWWCVFHSLPGRGESSASDGEEDNSVPREMDCVVIVGSERTINLQVLGTLCEPPSKG